MIKIKHRGNKVWRLEIQSEEFEFKTRPEMEKVLKHLMDLKESNGQLKNKDNDW